MQITEILEKICSLNLVASAEASLYSEACSVFKDKAKIERDKIGNTYVKSEKKMPITTFSLTRIATKLPLW